MAKPEWGTKRICPSCGARYYDLRKDPPVCPRCGTPFDPEALLKSRRARPAPVEEVVKKVPAESEDDEEAVEAGEAELEETDDEVAVDDWRRMPTNQPGRGRRSAGGCFRTRRRGRHGRSHRCRRRRRGALRIGFCVG